LPRLANLVERISLALLLLASTSTLGCRRDERVSEVPQKIVLISIDTTRADHLSAYGYLRETSPALSRLSDEGVRFVRAYSPMPTTDPSHATMLTGEYPRTHGIVQNAAKRRNPRGPSLGAWLRERGYFTAAITARLGLDPTLRGIRGFDYTDSPRLPIKWRSAGEVVDRVRGLLDVHESTRPLFLWVHLWEPHKPYEPSEERAERFGGATRLPKLADPPRFLAAGETVSAEQVEGSVRLYDAEIATADEAVSRIVAAARAAAPRDVEPLVVIVSDHGESLAERQDERRIAFGHGALLYDEVVRVPWIVHWPGVLAPARIETPVSLVDLAPTLAGLVDPAHPLVTEGRDLAREIRRGGEPTSRAIIVDRRPFATHPLDDLAYGEIAWIDFPWKMIVSDGPRGTELYDLNEDPEELTNRASERPEVAERLLARLRDWERKHSAGATTRGTTRKRAAELEALRSLGYIE